jgi:hypothetical protein
MAPPSKKPDPIDRRFSTLRNAIQFALGAGADLDPTTALALTREAAAPPFNLFDHLLGIVAAAKQTLHLARSARRPRPVNPNALPQPCRLVLEAARAPRQDRADSATMVIPMPQPKPAPVSPLPPASPPPRMPPAQPQPLPLATTEDDREPAIGDPAVQRKILTFADPARS